MRGSVVAAVAVVVAVSVEPERGGWGRLRLLPALPFEVSLAFLAAIAPGSAGAAFMAADQVL